MLIDLHVHTTKYSTCSRMSPEEMAEAAINRGLDGVVITEHNYLWAPEDLRDLRKKYPSLKIFNAIEVTIRGQEDFLVYGVTNPDAFYKDITLNELVTNVRRENSTIAVAHPYRYRDEVINELFECQIDFIEVASGNILYYMKDNIVKLQNKLELTAIASSDAHDTDSLGLYAVDFQDDIVDEQHLSKALKMKKFKLHGDIDKIKSINESLSFRISLVKAMLEEGAENKEIREKLRPKYGISYSFINGVKAGKDMHLLTFS